MLGTVPPCQAAVCGTLPPPRLDFRLVVGRSRRKHSLRVRGLRVSFARHGGFLGTLTSPVGPGGRFVPSPRARPVGLSVSSACLHLECRPKVKRGAGSR